MRVLFVSSGNAKTETGLSPIIMAQGKSLEKAGIEINYYGIKGTGLTGYLKAVPSLRKAILKGNYDLVHVHYGLSAFAVGLTFSGVPIVTSLMGSDVLAGGWLKKANKFFARFFWDTVIVKSEDMKLKSELTGAKVVPNGVDLERFIPMDRSLAKQKMGWNPGKMHLLFGSNPARPEKNFKLFKAALNLINKGGNIEYHPLQGFSHEEIPILLNASDVVVLSSKWEGSPNVIKESMACNCTIVSTLVGDVPWLFEGSPKGCFGSSLNLQEFKNALEEAISFRAIDGEAAGRNRIEDLALGEKAVANHIIEVYKQTKSK